MSQPSSETAGSLSPGLFVHFQPPTDWVTPTHANSGLGVAGSLQCTDSNANLVQRQPQRYSQAMLNQTSRHPVAQSA